MAWGAVCSAANLPPPLLGFDKPERSGDRPPQATRRVSGLNQKAIRKGQRYAIIQTDVQSGCVIDLVEGRTSGAALQLLGRQRHHSKPQTRRPGVAQIRVLQHPGPLLSRQAGPHSSVISLRSIPLRPKFLPWLCSAQKLKQITLERSLLIELDWSL